MTDPICDITEVTAAGDAEAFSTIGQFVEVSAAAAVAANSTYTTLTEVAAAASVSSWDRMTTRVQETVVGTVSKFDHLTARSFVNVTARGDAAVFHVLRDLAAVSAAGAVAATQSPVRNMVAVSAAGAVTAIQLRRSRSMVSVSAKGASTITNARAVRQIVNVSAEAAVTAIQRQHARNMVSVSAAAATTLLNDHATRRQFVTVAARASVQAVQTLLAKDLAAVEAAGDAEIVDPSAGCAAWTAATESLGMSRHVYGMTLMKLAPFDSTMLAIGPGGIYLLDGNDDGKSAPRIAATITGPLVDTGDSALKRPVALYISYTSTNPVGVAVGETSTGSELTWNYTSPPFAQNAPRPIRVPTGKGLRSRYLRFIISNTEGAPLKVFAAEYDYLQTGRRT